MGIFSLLQTILSFVVAFSVLVVVHEMGHYLAARWCNVKVLRFSLGMGQVVWMRKFGRDQTEWALSALPLGGYVKMLDARDPSQGALSDEDAKREFTRQSVWARILILVAGPAANFILAIGIFTLLNNIGVPEPSTRLRAMPSESIAYQQGLRGGQSITAIDGEAVQLWSEVRSKLLLAAVEKKRVSIDTEIEVGEGAQAGKRLSTVHLDLGMLSQADLEADFMQKLGLEVYRPAAILGTIAPQSPLLDAGMQRGDKILAINQVEVLDALDFVMKVRAHPGEKINIEYLRDGKEMQAVVSPMTVDGPNQTKIGRLMVEISAQPEMRQIPRSLPDALLRGATSTWDLSIMSFKMIGKMVTGEVSLRNLTGPITIADYAGQTAKIGWFSYLHYIAFISMSLGVMNLLPIPLLDGGYLLYYSLEILRGRPLPERFVEIAQRIGTGLLMTLMAVAMFNDIARHLP